MVLKRETPETPLGIVNDKAALQDRRLLVVRKVVAGSPAAVAGVLAGDVVERLGGEDAAEVALRGRGRATTADLDAVVRRSPASSSSHTADTTALDPFLLSQVEEVASRCRAPSGGVSPSAEVTSRCRAPSGERTTLSERGEESPADSMVGDIAQAEKLVRSAVEDKAAAVREDPVVKEAGREAPAEAEAEKLVRSAVEDKAAAVR